MSKSIHIGIDGNEANVLSRVGSNNYAFYLIHQLHDLESSAKFTVFLKSPPVVDMPQENKNWQYRVLTPKKLWTQWRLPVDLYFKSKNLDVFFSPGHYAPRKSPTPSVVTILDLSFIKHPNLFLKNKRGANQLKNWTEYSAKNAKQIITISEHSKKDIQDIYQIDPKHVSVAYPGIDRNFFKPASIQKQKKVKTKYNLGDDFILYVGTIQPRKNLTRLLKAFELLPSKFNNTQLVIAGQKGWLYESFIKELNASPKKNQVRLTGFVDNRDLPTLYSAASCSVLIGFYEGFGIPPAESLACGTIPVVANTSSLPEVVGEAGITVDPHSVTGIRHGLSAAISMPQEKKKTRLKIAQKQLTKFDWQKSAKIVMEVLNDVAIQG